MIMTSSVDEFSDNRDADEVPNCSACPTTGTSSPSVAAQCMQFLTPSQIEAGQTVDQVVYPYPDPYYRSIFATSDVQPYPVQPYPPPPMVHFQFMGIQQAGVPLPSDTVEEPVFVNAKQYNGILRRRQSRAKAESKNKLVKPLKPYLHESRHLHALRRERGSGGRFLKSKKGENQQEDANRSQANTNTNSDKNETASSVSPSH